MIVYSENLLDKLLPIITFSYSPKHKDARLLNHPVWMEEQFFQEGQYMQQQFIPEHVGQHIQSRC